MGTDVENLQTLQRLYDHSLAGLGPEDPAVRALRSRLDAARAKQRAAKPILQQVQAAQRKAARHEKQLEAARTKLRELEEKRDEINKELKEQADKVGACDEEVGKCKAELRDLLEKAKVEKGGDTKATTAESTAGSATPAPEDLHGAAAAWNAAKSAIEARLAALPEAEGMGVRQAIAAQYAAMENILNQIPPPTQLQPTAATAAAAAAASAQLGTQPQQLPPAADGKEADEPAAAEMLDIDDAVIEKLAEILTVGNGGGVDEDGGGGDADPNAGDGSAGNEASAKIRKLRESQVAAARQCLGKILVRKPMLRKK